MGILGNLLRGKPAFEVPPDDSGAGTQAQATSSEQSPAATLQQQESKVIPRVDIERVESHIDSNRPNMRVMARIKNNSAELVEVDNIRVLGATKQLGVRQLRPGESYDFNVYDGARATQTGGNNDDATLVFKKATDKDYFEAHYRVEFRKEADNTSSISKIIYTAPKDI